MNGRVKIPEPPPSLNPIFIRRMKMKKKEITKSYQWAKAVKKSDLPPVTKHVLLNLYFYMNPQGEGCYPSITTQAKDTSLSERAVYSAIALAVDSGYLIKTKRLYKNNAHNEYKAVLPPAMNIPAYGSSMQEVQAHEGGAGVPLHVVHPNFQLELPEEKKEDTSSDLFHKSSDISSKENSGFSNSIPPGMSESHSEVQKKEVCEFPQPPNEQAFMRGFEKFWKAYPLKKGKVEAIKAFRKAVTLGHVGDIIEGAAAYADECRRKGTEKKYIKHAQGWLNGQRWNEYLEDEEEDDRTYDPYCPPDGKGLPLALARELGILEHIPARLHRER